MSPHKLEYKGQENPLHRPSVFVRGSRERTASVRRQHRELAVLIKIFFLHRCMRGSYARQQAWIGRGRGGSLNSCLLWNKPWS